MIPKNQKVLLTIFIITCLSLFIVLFFVFDLLKVTTVKEKSSTPLNRKPNIIILLLDCVRADHLSCYGYTRNTSPTIDALAKQGIKYNYAISQAPWTFPSVFSLLSGYYPHKHGVWLINKKGSPFWRRLMMPSKSIPLLPELLQRAGYHTWGFSTNTYIDEQRMKERGFNEFKYIWKAPAMEVVNYGIEKIRQAEKTGNHFFLYLHFMDSHHPLQPPEKYYNFFPTNDGEKNRRIHEGWKFKRYIEQQGNEFDNYREHKISLYDGTIRYTDAEIDRLLTELRNSSLIPSTIIILLADHGDELWDHAAFEATHYKSFQARQGTSHGHTLFQELIHVPLIITAIYPKGKPPSLQWRAAEIGDVIQLADVVPTVLDLTGLSAMEDSDGTSLLPLINRRAQTSDSGGTRLKHHSVFAESTTSGNLKISLIEYPYKFIYAHKETNTLFNIQEDPLESNNLVGQKASLASDMLEKIYRFKKEKPPETEEVFLSKEDLDKLQALGYIDNDK